MPIKKKQNQTRKWNCLLSLVRTKSFLTLLHRCDECKLSKYRLDISAFRDKEFKGHAHLNSIQLYFTFFSKVDWVITFNFAMLAFFTNAYLLAADERVSFLAIETELVWLGFLLAPLPLVIQDMEIASRMPGWPRYG